MVGAVAGPYSKGVKLEPPSEENSSMPLSNEQIARYSRQIIIPKMGGRAQERLLSSRLVIIGALEDIEEPLKYLVGVGVGDIDLCVPDSTDAQLRALCDKMRDRNPDSTVRYGSLAQIPDLLFALLGNNEVVRFATAEAPGTGPAVVARLDAPGKIALLPSPPPCLRCASGDLLDTFGTRGEYAGLIAMLATTEALKMLAAYDANVAPTLISFDGPKTIAEPLASSGAACSCSHK
jgi:molybdopterin/thiamine biosynthesis adenylyltransferase